MVKRISDAEWHGDLQNGGGTVSFGSGAFNGPYSYKSRLGTAAARTRKS